MEFFEAGLALARIRSRLAANDFRAEDIRSQIGLHNAY